MIPDKQKIPFYKRLLSFVRPVWIAQYSSPVNPYLEILLYNDRLQLATTDALYSDGRYYTPATTILRQLGNHTVQQCKSVLLLGGGLGSFIDVMAFSNHFPAYTMVELDEEVLGLALEYLQRYPTLTLNPVNADAAQFVITNKQQFDLVFVDVFVNRTVPAFVQTAGFLLQCCRCLSANGYFAMNYIVEQEDSWALMQQLLNRTFSNVQITTNNINKIITAQRPR